MRRTGQAIGLLAASLLAAACASNVGDESPAAGGPAPQWPPPPQAARISYLYSVTTPADAKISRGVFSKAWRFIKGGGREGIARPQGIHVDPAGRLYVVDTRLGKVHVFDPARSRYHAFPDESIADFESPVGVTADGNGRVYVSDSSAQLVHVFDSFGKKYLSSFGAGVLQRPTGLALRPARNELLVVDTLASAIVVFDTRDFTVKERAGRNGDQQDALHYPTNIAVAANGEVYVTDALNFRIQVLNAELGFIDSFGEAGDGPGTFSRPKGIATDSDRNIYVVDALFDNVQIFNRNGDLLLAFGASGHAAGEFWLPSDIFIDAHDVIYVADSYNSRVQVFQYLSKEAT